MHGIVLLMDNIADALETWGRFLQQLGYKVLKAHTLEEAEKLLLSKWIHVAIMDIRMQNEDDENDITGLLLAQRPEFRPIPKIMLTAYPSFEYVRMALAPDIEGKTAAAHFVSKTEEPQVLKQAIEHIFANHVRINWDLQINLDPKNPLPFPCLLGLLQPDLSPDVLPDWIGELEDLFRKLFYEKAQITIDRLLWHRGARVCIALFSYSPEGALEQLVVTTGRRHEIEQEFARYKECAPKESAARATFAETMHFAAVAYALPGADLEQIQTFENFYYTSQVGQIREALQHLFQNTLAAWHQGQRILETSKSLSLMYRECVNLPLETMPQTELQRRIQELCQDSLTLGPTRISLSESELSLQFPNGDVVSYPNPISYIYEEQGKNNLPVVCCVAPGTLAEDNVLVDPNGQTWLTDFAQAGNWPLLWNFISMEAAVRFHLVRSLDLQALHHFEGRLVDPARLNERLDIQDMDAPFQKALRVVQEIRRLAFYAGGDDAVPYYKGLLFCALKEAAGYTPAFKHTRHALARFIHALLAAAMIGGRLKELTEELTSEDYTQIQKGIEVDEANRQVWVQGRRIKLSPLEFDLLLYLYKHPGQLCTRRSIVEEVFKQRFLGKKEEQSRVNTLIGRLRKRLGLTPPYPPYIETVRSEGYTLYLGNEEH